MSRKITKHAGGRPTIYSEEILKKLEDIFKVGGTITEACNCAGISIETYYNWLERYSGLLKRMESAQSYADIAAKQVIVDAIVKGKDQATSKWWLEKHQSKVFGASPAAIVNIQNNNVTLSDDEVAEFIEFRNKKRKKLLESEDDA